MKLLQSGIYVYNLDPVNRYDRRRQYELRLAVGQLADDSGSFQSKTIVAPFQRLSSKQSPRDLFSAGLNNHAARNSPSNFQSVRASTQSLGQMVPTSETDSTSTLLTLEWDRLYNTMKYGNHECTT